MMALRQGHYPTRPGEVALTAAVADLLVVDIGARVELGGVERTVVGLVENPSDLSDEFDLVVPNQDAAVDSLTLLFDDVQSGRGAARPTSGPAQMKFAEGRQDPGSTSENRRGLPRPRRGRAPSTCRPRCLA